MRLEQKDPFSSPGMGPTCQLVRKDPSGVTEGCRKEQDGMPAVSHKLEFDIYWFCRAVILETLVCVWGGAVGELLNLVDVLA